MSREVIDNHKLAIIIPAYKAKFLPETLDSIAAQTDKRFFVYIGDDNSPEDIETIVSRYKGKFNYVYKRFEENIGGKDLVCQWERCIAMSSQEPWIWLFSDDDIMDAGCVSDFYNTIQSEIDTSDIYRFDLRTLNNGMRSDPTCLPNCFTPKYLLKGKVNGKIPCFAVEYIFTRHIYEAQGHFQKFDLAWHSDIATWMKFGTKGITTIKGSCVTWRNSGANITAQKNISLDKRKWIATIDFLSWLRNDFFKKSIIWRIYTDFFFLKIIRGNVISLPLSFCLNHSKSYLGKGIRMIILKCFAKIYVHL